MCYFIRMKPTSTSWGGVAEWYDDLLEQSADSYQKNVIMPNILRLIDPKKGMTILDIACGQGYFSRAYAAAGAKVIGCDISIELIEKAQAQKVAGGDVEYYVAPADNLSFIENGSVDVATITLALQNIENLAGAIAEASRALKSGGRLIFVINHPAFRIPGGSEWVWDESKSVQFRRLDSYMSDNRTKIDMTPGEKDAKKKKFTVSFHRPLQSYFKALSKAGLSVARLEEWISHKKSQPGPRAEEEDRMRKEIPMFVCVEAKK
jgi:ubiquinone/menaquinone biosynthesis C-methylase UbiE